MYGSMMYIKKQNKKGPVAIGELRLTHFNQVDLDEIKHEINVLKWALMYLYPTTNSWI